MAPKFKPETEARIVRVLDAKSQNPTCTLPDLANQYNVNYKTLLAHYQGRGNMKSKGGQNKALWESQELALRKFLDRSIHLRFPV
jgi:hypothetical protein